MTKEERKIIKERWEMFSPIVRKTVKTLKTADLLKLPDHMKGWGLAAHLSNMVAEEIEKVLNNL